MDADSRGLEESAGDTGSAGDDFYDAGGDRYDADGDSGAGDDFADLSDEAPGDMVDQDAETFDEEAETVDEVAAEDPPQAEEGARSAESAQDEVYEIDPSPHSLLSVLFPAKPPRPRNARVIRLFDLEAGKNDGEPEEPVVEEPPKEEPRSRESIRAARNQSLAVAARMRLG